MWLLDASLGQRCLQIGSLSGVSSWSSRCDPRLRHFFLGINLSHVQGWHFPRRAYCLILLPFVLLLLDRCCLVCLILGSRLLRCDLWLKFWEEAIGLLFAWILISTVNLIQFWLSWVSLHALFIFKSSILDCAFLAPLWSLYSSCRLTSWWALFYLLQSEALWFICLIGLSLWTRWLISWT